MTPINDYRRLARPRTGRRHADNQPSGFWTFVCGMALMLFLVVVFDSVLVASL